ncbi:MAG TPA: GAF domain-containing protein [Candidatus Polarisedimenticolaceae bacterium]|nr:GAF domain-containing protein [Candidatus Polarisedimenticolaceae bacterium]
MSRDAATLETLDRKLAELASFLSPSEIFRALLEGTVAGAPRASVFLLREGRWKGWSSIGYPAPAAARQRQMTTPADAGWLAALAAEEDVRWRSLTEDEEVPDFGQPPSLDAVGLPVRVGGKTVAVVIAERSAGESPWSPAALSILCQAARLRLELDLAWRRLKSVTAASAPAAAPVVTAAAAPPPAPIATAIEAEAIHETTPSAPAEAGAAAASEMAPWSGVAAGTIDADPRREEARRYARLVATDIRLYNEETVIAGRRQRDLAARLAEQLQRGREAFSRRFPDLGADGGKLLEEAYVQVLGGGDRSLFS